MLKQSQITLGRICSTVWHYIDTFQWDILNILLPLKNRSCYFPRAYYVSFYSDLFLKLCWYEIVISPLWRKICLRGNKCLVLGLSRERRESVYAPDAMARYNYQPYLASPTTRLLPFHVQSMRGGHNERSHEIQAVKHQFLDSSYDEIRIRLLIEMQNIVQK